MAFDQNSEESKQILKEFIEIYKEEECLWRINSRYYLNRDKKKLAHKRLLDKFKEINPTANYDTILRKINTLRSNVRKEKKRREILQKEGEPFKANLWYFKLFDFLEEIEPFKKSTTATTNRMISPQPKTAPTKLNILKVVANYKTNDFVLEERASRAETQAISSADLDDIIQPPPAKQSKPNDEQINIFSKMASMKLKDISNRSQCLIAEKLINDAIYMAEMGQLNGSHKIVNCQCREKQTSQTKLSFITKFEDT